MRDLFVTHGVREYIRSDNGPELISHSLRSFLDVIDVGKSYIELGSPWQNGFVKSFHSRFGDKYLACELFWSLAEARQFSASSACAPEAENCRLPAVSLN